MLHIVGVYYLYYFPDATLLINKKQNMDEVILQILSSLWPTSHCKATNTANATTGLPSDRE